LQSAGRELKYPSPSYDEYNVHYDNLINLYGLSENFNSSFFSVITESQYAEPYGIITEKTFNAIVAGHPFLMVGHKGCLDDLRSYGFKTYPMIFDEEYQHLPNADRIDHMIEMNEHWFVQKLNATDIFEWDMETSEVVDYNLNFFFDDFGNEQVSWLRKQLLNAWF
jgi:hypothetical protein